MRKILCYELHKFCKTYRGKSRIPNKEIQESRIAEYEVDNVKSAIRHFMCKL